MRLMNHKRGAWEGVYQYQESLDEFSLTSYLEKVSNTEANWKSSSVPICTMTFWPMAKVLNFHKWLRELGRSPRDFDFETRSSNLPAPPYLQSLASMHSSTFSDTCNCTWYRWITLNCCNLQFTSTYGNLFKITLSYVELREIVLSHVKLL